MRGIMKYHSKYRDTGISRYLVTLAAGNGFFKTARIVSFYFTHAAFVQKLIDNVWT